MSVAIRPARLSDVLPIARAHVEADWQTYEPIFGSKARKLTHKASRERWYAAFAAGDLILVAMETGKVVGFASVSGDWLSALYLLASHQRAGPGSRLLKRICDELVGRRVTTLRFQTVAANAGAIAFYKALGAQIVGRKLEGEGDDSWEDLVFSLCTSAPATLLSAFRADPT